MGGGRELLRGVDNARTQDVAQRGTWGNFDELLVAPLDRAFTLPQMADRPVPVANDLHLDMPRFTDQTFDIDVIASKGSLRFRLTTCVGVRQL